MQNRLSLINVLLSVKARRIGCIMYRWIYPINRYKMGLNKLGDINIQMAAIARRICTGLWVDTNDTITKTQHQIFGSILGKS